MKTYQRQRGLIIPPLLLILAALTLMGITFITMVRFQSSQSRFQQATITAGYVAEIGFKEIQAELAKHGGKWDLIKGGNIVTACGAADPDKLRCQHTPTSGTKTDFHKVYENPLDTTSKVVGMYEAKIETGEKHPVFGNKTVTGSSVGYFPAATIAADKKGFDYQGNELCDLDVDGCPSRYIGIQVNAYLTDLGGNPTGRTQTVYGVIEVGGGANGEAPSGFLLDSNKAVRIESNTEYSPTMTGAIPFETIGGLFGPVHTNENFIFKWRSTFENKNSAAANTIVTTATNIERRNPHLQILQTDKGTMGIGVTVFDPFTGTPPPPAFDYVHAPPGIFWQVNWNGAGPPAGGTFQIVFADSTTSPLCNHGAAGGIDTCFVNMYKAVSHVNFGGTNYTPPAVTITTRTFIDWKSNTSGAYRIRYVDHDPIRVFEAMSYGTSSSSYEYTHEHPTATGWPLYKLDHSHAGIMGANLGTGPAYHASFNWSHTHSVSSSPLANTQYFDFLNSTYQPASGPIYPSPLLKAISPDPGFSNYKNQLEQLNKYLQLTIGYAMPRNPDGSLNDTSIPSSTDYNMGYIVGNAGLTPPSVTLVDFRAVYFGNDLRYSAGTDSGNLVLPSSSAISDEAFIWVNENKTSSDYMKVAKTQLSTDYHKFNYKQIPPSEILLVRDAAIFIGNHKPKGSIVSCSSHKADCLDTIDAANPGDATGESTIIDGKLAIISFSTYPTATGTANEYNKGDIIITGNVIYRNQIAFDDANPSLMRQLDPLPVGYTRSLTVSPLAGSLSSKLNSEAPVSNTDLSNNTYMWVTNTDGTLHRDGLGTLVGKHNGLGLFATNDIKVSVTGLFHNQTEEDTNPNAQDTLYVYGQLIAGNKIYVHARDNTTAAPFDPYDNSSWPNFLNSQQDKLIFVGSLYSNEPTNLSTYFEESRLFFYDRSLYINPLIGAPYYPDSVGDYRNQLIFNTFPRLVPGTWKQQKIKG